MLANVFSLPDKSKSFKCIFIFVSLSISSVPFVDCHKTSNVSSSSGYSNIKSLQDSILSSANYSTTLRPVNDQIKPIVIDVTLSLVAVVAVDNVKQELVTNGFVFLFWDDERLTWDPDDYGGVYRLTPALKEMWLPRLSVINTLGKRDPFDDDYSHLNVHSNGKVYWAPGSIFHTYCALNIQKFPFDVQTCLIQLLPMSNTGIAVQFEVLNEVDLTFYISNAGWELLKADVTIENVTVGSFPPFSCPTFKIQLKRRPITIVLNVIIPVILLSILNNLVFLIPVDSGEKVSYAISVLLALTVFLSMVSTMTPQVSDVIPALTVFLFVLLLSSVLTVVAAVFSTHLHNLDEKEEQSIKSRFRFMKSARRMFTISQALTAMDAGREKIHNDVQDNPVSPRHRIIVPGHNPYRVVAKHIDTIFFLIMNSITLVATVIYVVFTNT